MPKNDHVKKAVKKRMDKPNTQADGASKASLY